MSRGMTRREREITDIDEIRGILDRAKIVHVGMVDGNRPYVVPMNYGYTLNDGKLTFYLHGAMRGRKLDVIRANPNVFVELDTDIVPFEGEVACKYGLCYSSVMGEGVAFVADCACIDEANLQVFLGDGGQFCACKSSHAHNEGQNHDHDSQFLHCVCLPFVYTKVVNLCLL